MKIKTEIYILTALIAALCLSTAPFFRIEAQIAPAQAKNQIAADLATPMEGAAPAIIWPSIKAPSAIVYDPVGNELIYQKNPHEKHGMASLVKVMTAAVVNEFLNMNPKLAEKQVKITSRTEQNAADRALVNDSSWYPEELVNYMLIGSSNKAAESLAANIIPRTSFISYMNFLAKQYGLASTTFYNESGLSLPDSKTKKESPAGVTTAKEMATLFWAVISQHPGLLDITAREKAEFSRGKTLVEIKNTNRILHDFPIKFGKTGFTEFAGGNLAVVLQRDETSHPYIIVVLGSTEEERFSDMAKLASTTLANYK